MNPWHFVTGAALFGAWTLTQALVLAPYTPQALADAQAARRPVALLFHAPWCPVCLAQDRALRELRGDPALDITVLRVDYDTEKDLERRWRIRTQSTLIVLKGSDEVAWSIGESRPSELRATLAAGLGAH